MKLHRLVLTNYRGIGHREIEFPDHGVVVVSGANEIGKSSMIEALDLLLESRDRSTKKEVKQVKPTNSDVGSEVTAEISSGTYRFIYRKRFHKKPETELTVLVPRREQLTGDEAHERVRSMLAETVDNELWHAQRVLQSTSTAAVDLSGCDALSRALDVAAGDQAALSGNEPLLIERIDAEYARYFTPTGRPTGEWAAAIARLSDAEAVVDQVCPADSDTRCSPTANSMSAVAVNSTAAEIDVSWSPARSTAAAALSIRRNSPSVSTTSESSAATRSRSRRTASILASRALSRSISSRSASWSTARRADSTRRARRKIGRAHV